jgi:hypothetical protein
MRRIEYCQPMAIVVVAAVLITVVFWAVLPARYHVNDNIDYISFHEPVARNLLAGEGLVVEAGKPAIRYPPGYPLLLAAIFGLADLLRVSENIVLSLFIAVNVGMTAIFVFCFAQSIWAVVPSLMASLIWISHPFVLWLTKQPNTETPFMALLFGGFYLFWRTLRRRDHYWAPYFCSGVTIGFAMLIRPIALWVGVLLAAMAWVVGREMTVRARLFVATMVLLGNLMTILPWEAWVYFKTHRIVPLSTIGHDSLARGLTIQAFPENYRHVFSQSVATLMRDIEERAEEMRSLGGILSVWLDEFRSRPIELATVFAHKAARSWFGTDNGSFETLLIAVQIPYLSLLLWASYRAWTQGGLARQLMLSIWLFVIYFWAMSTLGFGLLRYMVPAMGLLMVLVPSIFCSPSRQSTVDPT